MPNAAQVARWWGQAQPYVRQFAPQVAEFAGGIISHPLFGPAVAAAEGIYKGYKDADAATQYLYGKEDYSYRPSKTGTHLAEAPPPKRIKLIGGYAATGGSNNSASSAAQGTDWRRENNLGSQRRAGGTSVNTQMVRRIYSRRVFGRRRRNPAFFTRRLYRGGWSSQSSNIRRRRFWKPEKKFFDVVRAGTTNALGGGLFFQADWNFYSLYGGAATPTAGNTTNMVSMVEIQQGTDAYQRIGDQIVVTSLMARGCVKTPVSKVGDDTYNNCVTVYLIQDRQANGEIPLVSDFLVVGASTDPSTSMRNLANRSRFKVLAKRQMILIGGTNANTYFFEISYKKPIKVTYSGSNGTYDQVKTNQIWLVLCDNLASSAANPDTTHAFCETIFFRTRFADP